MPKGRAEMKDRLTDANSIVTLNNGETPTLAEYIAARGQGDSLTDFVATEADLVSLAYGIVDDLLAQEFLLQVCVTAGTSRDATTRNSDSEGCGIFFPLFGRTRWKNGYGRDERRTTRVSRNCPHPNERWRLDGVNRGPTKIVGK